MATTVGEQAKTASPRLGSEALRAPAARPVKRRKRRWPLLLVLLGMLGGGGWYAVQHFKTLGSDAGERVLTQKVTRADLLITVVEDGNVESTSNTDVRCQVAGGSVILWIIADGTMVKKDDELVRLDSSTIEDQVNTQKIVFERAQAARIQAEKEYSAAKIAVQEYIEGTYLKELQLIEAQITIAMENLRSSENSLQHTERMARKGYVTPLQLESQKFAVERSKLDLETARTSKRVLQEFTRAKMLEELESTRDSAEARMRSEQAATDLEQGRLKRFLGQLEQCVIKAPDDGMVVYANEMGGRGQQTVKIEEGAAVRERQSIVRLPDLSQMQVKVLVHESKIDSLRPGMRARVTIQDRELQGEVMTVANQPEPTSFFSSAVKEYATIVKIDGESEGLKPGMTAEVEILVADLKDALAVPVQAVVEQGGKFYCWAMTPAGPQKRQVVLGASNNTVIEIKDGIASGDDVLLNPRAIVPAANEDVPEKEQVDIAKRFGNSQAKPVAASGPAGVAAAPGGAPATTIARADGGRPRSNPLALDRDGDKKLSRDEAPEAMRPFFDTIDANHDGFLDAAELAAARKRREAQMSSPDGVGGGR
jgi:HlyD family secretion protein